MCALETSTDSGMSASYPLFNTATKYAMMFFILVFYAIISVTEGCSSRSTPKPRPTGPTPRPNITFHTYACPPMYATWYCLNGGTCFTVIIGEHRIYNCECAEGFIGPRCEFKDLDSSYLLSRKQVLLETASIAFGATLAVLLVVIVCMLLYIRYHRKQKQRLLFDTVDGYMGKPFSRR